MLHLSEFTPTWITDTKNYLEWFLHAVALCGVIKIWLDYYSNVPEIIPIKEVDNYDNEDLKRRENNLNKNASKYFKYLCIALILVFIGGTNLFLSLYFSKKILIIIKY